MGEALQARGKGLALEASVARLLRCTHQESVEAFSLHYGCTWSRCWSRKRRRAKGRVPNRCSVKQRWVGLRAAPGLGPAAACAGRCGVM